jgi:hypothetical protein
MQCFVAESWRSEHPLISSSLFVSSSTQEGLSVLDNLGEERADVATILRFLPVSLG